MNAKKSGLRSEFPSNRGIIISSIVLAAAALAFIFVLFNVYRNSVLDAKYLELAGELRVLAQTVATSSREALSGRPSGFALLSRSQKDFDETLKTLSNGTADLPSPRPLLGNQLSDLASMWSEVSQSAGLILENQERLLSLHEIAHQMTEAIPQLQQDYQSVVDALIAARVPSDQVALAQRQPLLAERISHNIDRMLQGGQATSDAAQRFQSDAESFGQILDGMLRGNAAMNIARVTNREAASTLERIAQAGLFKQVGGTVAEISRSSPELLQARQAADNIEATMPGLQNATADLANKISELDQQRTLNERAAMILGAVVLIALLAIGLQLIANARRSLAATAQTNEQNQQAILRLLDELAGLADGDLTTTATVTEDFTGAIADAINYTVDQLRVLVSSINSTSMNVSSAADSTRSTALQLAEAADHQAQEIAGASASISEMAITIDEVSSSAAESAGVADRSVSLAKTGSDVVQNTIRGMDTIREQIQETAKRIKRLGESSQEIGDIVSLINDIADQTNILALNAAIQASMAGDAGRGFAVVADEVQRLAERSGAATKQIEALVKTIQSDTNEAVSSMEQTTTEVVRGARLAEDAGVALEEIEATSLNLAEIIQSISNAARQQAAAAGHVSNTTNIIQEIASQTAAGATSTAQAIGELTDMSNELRNSVAGFKLPDSHAA